MQVLRGIALINAVVLVSEVSDLTYFANPRQLMAYFDIVPRERSTDLAVRRGGITKTGNAHVRRGRVEDA
ncbi:IS110 family transposase [Microvirga arvi]|uniref:IS110 family transposase n=1 Tax=Microvirga arvi TaxID=2778731 RepID=UPI00210468C0|nr:IS110 family transposase [Microvirga arvi]